MSDQELYRYVYSAEFYDGFPAYGERPDVAFYVEEAVRLGGPVLEVGCGTGRVLLPTARAGITITGLDRSAAMLERCGQVLTAEPEEVQRRVTLRRGDMRDFSLGATFRLITLPFRPFQHLEEVEEQLACLACVRQHLDNGGRLIFDLFNPWLEHIVDESLLAEQRDGRPFELPDGRRVQRKARIASQDLFRQVRYCEIIHEVTYPDGREERLVECFPMRYTFRYEMEHLLIRTGFEVEAVYGGFDRSPFGARYPGELIFVATAN
ncbi:MAG: SAM-dependent methyltransferase [Armatimonadetes bacterium CG_4_10_14_0_8_um_filter_66_14]|nr:class I SAM-dependent methyltransferase [Armatimonadota bacterium]PIU92351.1 MAG: SAM-dependent methyltransferase [Armatimonadetes bacterium CG06_land_8_20_14_3_00_66_21]PIZ35590.1 MAG: SAM-dependent methyltransferase [Armatimonadetes bacterium CG_4_10_14_0_8_um_filter_66_14]PJB69652.1 MAG: SAM-dependent methyltransferase [Armatimonadetes bacterium CG_4_9_14_3_um_filter_66_14]NCQ31396.1 class I SAM-dependent methyltransferase [Armatimonadota bacterium]